MVCRPRYSWDARPPPTALLGATISTHPAPAPGWAGSRALLRTAPFRARCGTVLLSAFADWLAVLAAALYAADHARGSAARGAVFGGVLAARLLLGLLPPVPAVAARLDRRGPDPRQPDGCPEAAQLPLLVRYVVGPVLASVFLAAVMRVATAFHAPRVGLVIALAVAAVFFLGAAVLAWALPAERAVPAGHSVRSAPARPVLAAGVALAAAAGVVVGTGPLYASSLGGGYPALGLLVAALVLGLGLGATLGPAIARTLSRPRGFGFSVVLAGVALLGLALAPHLSVAVPLAVLAGAGAGMAGAAAGRLERPHVVLRVVLVVALAGAAILGGVGGSRRLGVGLHLNTSRVLLLAAGLLVVAAGVVAFRRLDDRPGVPVLRDLAGALRGRPLGLPEEGAGDGLFVVFEGGEGAGKSTQAVKLAARLRMEGRACVLTREPGATELGARIRGILLDKSSVRLAPRAEALLYAADRAHHVASVIRPALARGEVVLSDRYVDSSLAYQGAGRDLPREEVAWLSEWATGGLRPDLVVLLDVDPAVGLGRVAERGEADRLEAEATAFHERVRQGFLDLAAADPERYLVLPAATDPDRLAEQVHHRVADLLAARADAPTVAMPLPVPADDTRMRGAGS